jgi:hypothetical protein
LWLATRLGTGGYKIHITADGSGNYTNVMQAFGGKKKSGYFLLFYRIYDLGKAERLALPYVAKTYDVCCRPTPERCTTPATFS